MSDVKWIKITTNILNDNKIKLIDSMPERDAIFRIWVGILTLAGQTNDNGMVYLAENMPYTEEMLATLFNRELNIIRLALDTLVNFKMIEILDNGILYITNWEKHQNLDKLEKIREQTRKRVAKHREKAKQIECNVTVTQDNATDKIRLDKIREEKNRKDKEKEMQFNQLWFFYPRHIGKKACYRKFLATLKKDCTFEQLLTATKNYAEKVRNEQEKYIKHGSTFFGPDEHWKDFLVSREKTEYKRPEDYIYNDPLKKDSDDKKYIQRMKLLELRMKQNIKLTGIERSELSAYLAKQE